MAIGQRFYGEFARYLAGLAYRVWTFDYRGMYESATGPMRLCAADLSDWVLLDTDAMVRHAHTEGHGRPVQWDNGAHGAATPTTCSAL